MEKYRLVKKIGQGSFGEVWLVKGSKTQKQYVLKQINLQHASKREQRAAHLEVKLLSTLKHPNIVSYLDSFYNSKGSLFIVMGYCENGDLYTRVRNQNGIHFPEKQIIEWLIQICMALKYLHDKKILHRDLKTQNIFLTRSNLIKVGDLGIARVLDRTTDMATTMIGTPYYMSPEIFCNKPYSFQSDVWALGCCMCEIATLKHAFHAGNFTSLVQRVLNGKVPGMHEQYSQEFHDIVCSMLSIDPEKRPSITDILLNSYVRSHIVTFLEETKNSAKLLPVRSLKSTTYGDDNTVSHDAVLTHINTSFMYRRQVSEQKVEMSDIFSSKERIFQTPDINGNGDGNDNSQHRYAVRSQGVSGDLFKSAQNCTSGKPDPNEIAQDLPLLPVHSHHQECRNGMHSGKIISESNANSAGKVGKSNYSARRALKSARKNGQMSFNFLRNLTFTINGVHDYPFHSNGKKTDNNHNTSWNCGNLPAISTGNPSFPGLSQNAIQFGFDHLKSKRFKSSGQSEIKCVGESKRNSAGRVSDKMHLIDDTEQKENFVCPNFSPENKKDHQLTVYKGSRIPIFNVSAQKEVEDFHTSKTNGHFDSLFPDISQHRLSLLKSHSEDCSTGSNRIDGSLLQKIINCNIKAKTMPGHLNSAARQRRRERENRKVKSLSAKPVYSGAKSAKNNVGNENAEVLMCYKEDAEGFIN